MDEKNAVEEMYRVYINSDGYYPKCRKCGYFDLEYLAERCPQCGCKQDWSYILKWRKKTT